MKALKFILLISTCQVLIPILLYVHQNDLSSSICSPGNINLRPLLDYVINFTEQSTYIVGVMISSLRECAPTSSKYA